MAVERELKFTSPDGRVPALAEIRSVLAQVGADATELEPVTHVDVYFDDEALSVQRAGMALRVRTSGGSRLATLKSRGSVMHGVHERDELEVALPAGTEVGLGPWPPEFQPHLPGVDLASLGPRMIITTLRHRFTVLEEGAPMAELAFDEVTGQPAAEVALQYAIDEVGFHEVELEALAAGGRAPVSAERLGRYGDALQDLIPLFPSDISKLERAATLLAAFAE